MKFKPLRSAFASLALVLVGASALADTYTVKSGDTLGRIASSHKLDWRVLCLENRKVLKEGCSKLRPDMQLSLVIRDETRARLEGGRDIEGTVGRVRPAKPVQEESCINLGAAPFNRYGDMKLRLQGIDLSPVLSDAEKAEAKELVKAGRGERMLVTSDMVFEAMPFRSGKGGKVEFARNKKVCTPEQGGRPEALEVWKLSTGKLIADFRTCGNIGTVLMTLRREPPPPPTEEERPPVTVTPPTVSAPPVTVEPPVLPPTKVTEAPKPKDICDHIDPDASIGEEYEPSHNDGDRAKSSFGTASAYCLNRLPTNDGSHGFGAKITATQWDWHGGRTNAHASGWNVLFGPSYKRVMDRGYNWEVSVAAGKQVEKYRQAAYESRREFDLFGLTAGVNDYRRREDGIALFPEWQAFGSLTFPVRKKVGHTIFGQNIADTKELSKFDFGFQAGFRQWLYETPDMWVLPYCQAGVFVQHPTSASASFRCGIADPNRIVGVHAGWDKDLKNAGDFVDAIGWHAAPIRGVGLVRDKVRRHQIVSDLAKQGVTIEEVEDGGHIIRFGEPSPKK